MCYYNGIKVSRAEFLRLKDLEAAVAAEAQSLLQQPVQNGFDYGNSVVLVAGEDKATIKAEVMQWGFLPPMVKNQEEAQRWRFGYKDSEGRFHPPYLSLNAIGEEILQPKKIYRDAALHRRCLVLSSNFFEWRHVFPMGKKGVPLKTAVKYPYSITVKDREYYYMAGIWQPWVDRDTGEVTNTFSIVTTKANPLMKIIHNSKERMPVILTEELAHEWLFGDLSEERILQIAQFQFPVEKMEAHTIDKDFRTAADPVAPVEYPGVPAIAV